MAPRPSSPVRSPVITPRVTISGSGSVVRLDINRPLSDYDASELRGILIGLDLPINGSRRDLEARLRGHLMALINS